MNSQLRYLFILFVVLITENEAATPYVPKVEGAFRAFGEMILPFNNQPMQAIFEETYDRDNHMAALRVSILESNSTIQENEMPGRNQSFMYDLNEGTCDQVTTASWESTGMGLKPFDVKGHVVFPLRQLLSLRESDLDTNGWGRPTVTYRGVTANHFTFKVASGSDTLTINAYWSDGQGGDTMSMVNIIPLGFKITIQTGPNAEPEFHTINIFSFTNNEINYQMLQPVRGIYCPDRLDPVKFPDLSQYQSMVISTEFTLADSSFTTAIDTWIDLEKKMLRADLEPLQAILDHDKTAQSIIFDLDRNVAYHMQQNSSRGCKLLTLEKENYYPQLIFDPRVKENWNAEAFFGTKNTNYVRTGRITDRGVPCELFQGERKDWPPGEVNITSVWEWCFVDAILPEVPLEKDQLGVVSLNIYITQSPYEKRKDLKPYKGLHITYNFYNGRKMAPSYMETLAFDILSCFDEVGRTDVYFLVDVSDSERETVLKINNLTDFNALWRSAVILKSGLTSDPLRISNLRTTFQDPKSGPLLVEFTILGVHKDLPNSGSAVSMEKAFTDLKIAVDGGMVAILWTKGNQMSELTAKKGSLKIEKGSTYSPQSPALSRFQAAMARYEDETKTKPVGHSVLVYLAVGVVSLQIGIAIGVAVVAIKRRRSQNAAAN